MTKRSKTPNDKKDDTEPGDESTGSLRYLDEFEAHLVIARLVLFIFSDNPPPSHDSNGERGYAFGELVDWLFDRTGINLTQVNLLDMPMPVFRSDLLKEAMDRAND